MAYRYMDPYDLTNSAPTFKTARPAYLSREVLEAGAFSGLISGSAFALFINIASMAWGAGFWFPMKLIAASVLGVEALVGGIATAALGLVINYAFAIVFSVIFALITARNRSYTATLVEGLVYGALIWALMNYVVLPVVNPVMAEREALTPVWWFMAHLVFGAAMSEAPGLAKNLAGLRAGTLENWW